MLRLALIAALVFTASLAVAQVPEPLLQLQTEVAGVTGSGEEIRLHLRGKRSLGLGQAFQDGWILSALSASSATFTRNGVSREIGLNPTGMVVMRGEAGLGPVVVTAGGLSDLLQRYGGTGTLDGTPAVKLGLGPAAPMIGLGMSLVDGWILVRMSGGQLTFERNGQYQTVGFDAEGRPVLGRPGQVFSPPGYTVLALTEPSFPDGFMQMPNDQRLAHYEAALVALQREALQRYGRAVTAWDIEATWGTAQLIDRDVLNNQSLERRTVSRTTLINPVTGQPAGELRQIINPTTGAVTELLSTGTGTLREATSALEAMRAAQQ